jgi:hypothetical protein
MEEEQRARTQKRETEIRGILDEVIGMYRPGGSFGQQMVKEQTAAGMQNLVSGGLANTTRAATVGMSARAKLEDLRFQGLASALGGKAGFVERITDRLPDYGQIAQLSSMAASGPPKEYGAQWVKDLFSGGGGVQPSRKAPKVAAAPITSPVMKGTGPMPGGKSYWDSPGYTPTKIG